MNAPYFMFLPQDKQIIKHPKIFVRTWTSIVLMKSALVHSPQVSSQIGAECKHERGRSELAEVEFLTDFHVGIAKKELDRSMHAGDLIILFNPIIRPPIHMIGNEQCKHDNHHETVFKPTSSPSKHNTRRTQDIQASNYEEAVHQILTAATTSIHRCIVHYYNNSK